MIKIAPSILSADFANLEREIRRISAADYVHVDVMDGIFVPNITIGIPVVAAIRKVTELPLDVHLMIDRPVRYVEEFCKAGADLVTVHVEADTGEAQDAGGGGAAVFGDVRHHPGDDRGAGVRRAEIHGGHDAQAAAAAGVD